MFDGRLPRRLLGPLCTVDVRKILLFRYAGEEVGSVRRRSKAGEGGVGVEVRYEELCCVGIIVGEDFYFLLEAVLLFNRFLSWECGERK